VTRPAIATTNLTRDFGALRALDQLSIEVPAGSIYGILGPNGAGKTTLVRLLLGLVEPSEGSATVLGFDVRHHGDEIRRRTGALLEHPGLYERLSAYDNLDYYARIWRLPEVTRRLRIETLMRHFGLWERRLEIVSTWGRGMQQKLAIARTLIHQPPLVFLDEPTAGLDAQAATALRKELATLSRIDGLTIVLTAHHLPEAEQVCDHVAVLRAGKLLATGKPSELREQNGMPQLEITGRGLTDAIVALLCRRPEVRRAHHNDGSLLLDLRGEVDTAPLVSLLVESGVEVLEVKRRQPSFDSAFAALEEAPL
jgi:ABC-2 type transport system ATP-binding protein